MSRIVFFVVLAAVSVSAGWPEWSDVALKRGEGTETIALKRGGGDEIVALKRGGGTEGVVALKRGGGGDPRVA